MPVKYTWPGVVPNPQPWITNLPSSPPTGLNQTPELCPSTLPMPAKQTCGVLGAPLPIICGESAGWCGVLPLCAFDAVSNEPAGMSSDPGADIVCLGAAAGPLSGTPAWLTPVCR